MNESVDETKLSVVQILAKFKADLLWDEIVGIFDLIPAELRQKLENHYEKALQAAQLKLNVPYDELRAEVEDLAYQKVNGSTYSAAEVKARLKEYGVNPEKYENN